MKSDYIVWCLISLSLDASWQSTMNLLSRSICTAAVLGQWKKKIWKNRTNRGNRKKYCNIEPKATTVASDYAWQKMHQPKDVPKSGRQCYICLNFFGCFKRPWKIFRFCYMLPALLGCFFFNDTRHRALTVLSLQYIYLLGTIIAGLL